LSTFQETTFKSGGALLMLRIVRKVNGVDNYCNTSISITSTNKVVFNYIKCENPE